MDKNILFNCACHMQSCSDCLLDELGCSEAPYGLLLKAARKHYAEMKRGDNFNVYDYGMSTLFGLDYAKELVAAKARVV